MDEQTTTSEQLDKNNEALNILSYPQVNAYSGIIPQAGCATCGSIPEVVNAGPNMKGTNFYIYAIGKVEARFPNIAVEKEFAQAIRMTDTAGKTDQQAFHAVLSKRENRYLVRQLCWVLSIQGLDTYLLLPSDPSDIDLLIESIRPTPNPNDIDVVIGMRGPVSPPTMCNGLMVPIVIFDQIYSFDRNQLIEAIPKSKNVDNAQFGPASEELFNRIMQMTDNAGATDEHRALNYLSMRYPTIYTKASEEFALDFSLRSVEVRPSTLVSNRKIVAVIFAYTNRKTDFTEKFHVRVDVTEKFPFLVAKMSPYIDCEIGGMR